MKHVILTTLLFISAAAHAANWPDVVAPCNTTLQACVDGSPEYETIFVNTDATINETITSFKVVSLIAGNGFKPVFGDGHGIDMTHTASTLRTVIIDGFTLTRGRIAYNHQSGSSAGANLIIRNNQVLANSSNLTSIRVLNQSDQTLDIKVDYNHITHTATSGAAPGDPRGGIAVRTGFNSDTPTGGTTTGRIYGNNISTSGPSSAGVGIFGQADTTVELNVAGNDITGGNSGGVYVRREYGTGSADINIGNNALYPHVGTLLYRGVNVDVVDGMLDVDIVNNTVVDFWDGIRFDEFPGATLNAGVYNNILAFGSAPVFVDAETNLSNDYNLLFMNTFSDADFTPGPNHIVSDPKLVSLLNTRLRASSPAIEAGNGIYLLLLGASPFVDADGTVRIKKGNQAPGASQVDVGAYETGDLYLTHVANDPFFHTSAIDQVGLNGQPDLDSLHITSNWNPPAGTAIYNNDNEGIYYELGQWAVFNQAIVDINPGAAFNVHHYGSVSNTFEHEVTASGSSNTVLDNSSLNGQADRILQVTQHWIGEYNPHPFGVFYFGGSWVISNFDLGEMPMGSNFNVYSQTPSKSAWRHIAATANIRDNITFIDHPLINNVRCAELQVTQSAGQGVFNDAPIGVYYEGGRWSVFNQDLSDMLPNSEFHITVNPEQIAQCSDLIFEDGLE